MSTWQDPYHRERESSPGLSSGSYGGTDERFKRRKRKQPIGFVPVSSPKPPVKRGHR